MSSIRFAVRAAWIAVYEIDWLDVALHVPMALAVYLAFHVSPGLGAALFLWVREAAQRDPGNIINGVNLFRYSAQKHAEIWIPAAGVELALRLV